MRFGIGRIGTTLVAGGLAGLAAATEHGYVNLDYRYRVDLPPGVSAERSDPPSPNHGFVARSPRLGDALVWVDASYDALLLARLEAVVEHHVRARRVPPTRNSASTLGGLPAQLLVFPTENGLEQLLLALRPEPDISVIFTIGLRCTEESCPAAQQLAEELRLGLEMTEDDESTTTSRRATSFPTAPESGAVEETSCARRSLALAGPLEVSPASVRAALDDLVTVGTTSLGTVEYPGYASQLAVIDRGSQAWTLRLVRDFELEGKRPVAAVAVPGSDGLVAVLDHDGPDGGDWEVIVLRGEAGPRGGWELCSCIRKGHYSAHVSELVMTSGTDGSLTIPHEFGDYYPGGDYVSTTKDGGCTWSPARVVGEVAPGD